MRSPSVLVGTVASILFAVATAAAATPAGHTHATTTAIAAEQNAGTGDAVSVLLSMQTPPVPVSELPARGTDQIRQSATVWFYRPVKVGDRVLFGKYIIEHDNQRMARGWPCTYIYAASDPQLPVVAFRCRHLERAKATANTVIVKSRGEPAIPTELIAFQFAGETSAHGVPVRR